MRFRQAILIVSLLLASWLGMQAVHESGHALAAVLTGGHVTRVVLHPLTISRTDVEPNQQPLLVVWAGPVFGVFAPLIIWTGCLTLKWQGAFLARFFAGFCLIANGGYIAGASFAGLGDAGVMLRHGSPIWTLWLFEASTVPIGLSLWHGQGKEFGLGSSAKTVQARWTLFTGAVLAALLAIGFAVGADP